MTNFPGWRDWNPDAHALAQRPSRTAKYRNRKTTVDGIVFDSAREAKRWTALQMLESAGHISHLRRQVVFSLLVNGKCLGDYVSDFCYQQDGHLIVEDAKGVRTDLYKWKRKHFEAQYGLTIRET